jgi:hypothetical protein
MDITKCANIECPLKENCYIFLAESDEFCQSFTDFTPVYNEETKEWECEYFIKCNIQNVRL